MISPIESDVPTIVHGSKREGICYLGPEHCDETLVLTPVGTLIKFSTSGFQVSNL